MRKAHYLCLLGTFEETYFLFIYFYFLPGAEKSGVRDAGCLGLILFRPAFGDRGEALVGEHRLESCVKWVTRADLGPFSLSPQACLAFREKGQSTLVLILFFFKNISVELRLFIGTISSAAEVKIQFMKLVALT